MTDLNAMTASEAAAKLATGEISARALTQAYLDQIAKRDEQVQAWAYLDPEYALAQADQADARRQSGEALGPLHGLPVGIKDIIDTYDMPTEHGCAAFAGRRPNADASCVALLRAAGAIIIGKTVTTELANTTPSKTRNPHDLAHTPGGSSAGSGAGVADFQIPLALGTQTGGSVIRPASFNGVYGLKPSLGIIPRAGVLLQSHMLDTVGVYGRSVDDLALITDSMSVPEREDAQTFAGSRPSLVKALAGPQLDGVALGFIKTPAWGEADAATQAAISKLSEDLGSMCEPTDLAAPFDRVLDLHGAIFAAENWYYYGHLYREQPQQLSEKIRGRLADAQKMPAERYIEALRLREVIYADMQAKLDRYDALLCLAAAGPAPKGFETTGSPAFNSPWTYLGVPCVSLPRLRVNGLPVGVQLVGARGNEAHLLKVASWLDKRLSTL